MVVRRSNAFCGRKIIRNQKIVNSDSQDVEILPSKHRKSGNTQTKFVNKKICNKKTAIIYTSVFVVLMLSVAVGFGLTQQNQEVASASSEVSLDEAGANKVALVDESLEANVVAGLAETANLSVAPNTAERAVSISAMKEIAQNNNSAITKPQNIGSTSDSKEIVNHVVKEGETSDSIAAAYGISTQTLTWSNNVKSSDIKAGKELKILPVDGITHVVKDGETVKDLAEKYGASEDRITSYNDLELNGAAKDQEIVIPGGVLPEKERPEYEAPKAAANTAPTTNTSPQKNYDMGTSTPNSNVASAGNKYAYGYCTWYVYERRAQLGRPIGSFWGNASSWAASASAAGFVVNSTPAVGAIIQNGGGYGHVAVVERVNPDGSLLISEMNGPAGWNVIGQRTISAGEVGMYRYIH